MQKYGVEKDLHIVSLMCRFIRLKRELNQKDVAEEAGISQATVGFLESCKFQKTSAKNIEYIFDALRLHKRSLKDPSLYQLISKYESNNIILFLRKTYPLHVDHIIKVFSAVFDAYSASLGWQTNLQIADKSDLYKKLCQSDKNFKEKNKELLKRQHPLTELEIFGVNTGFPDYLPSIIVFNILNSLSERELKNIFHVDGLTLEASPQDFEDELLEDLISDDPFVRLMRCLKIPFADYFLLISKILRAPDSLRFANLESFKDKVFIILDEIHSIIEPSGQKQLKHPAKIL